MFHVVKDQLHGDDLEIFKKLARWRKVVYPQCKKFTKMLFHLYNVNVKKSFMNKGFL